MRQLNLPHVGLDYLLSGAGGTSGSFSRDVAVKIVRVYHQHRWQFSPRRLAAGGVLLDRPIFLLGVPGNGATLMALPSPSMELPPAERLRRLSRED